MDKVNFPAVLVLARWDDKEGNARVFTDGRICWDDNDLADRLAMYRDLEAAGGTPYELTLAEVEQVEEVKAARAAWLAYEHGAGPNPEAEPDPSPSETDADPLELAYQAARRAFAGNEPQLRRLDRALNLVKLGYVYEDQAKPGDWLVRSDLQGVWRVNGGCTCPDGQYNGRRYYCKHYLAVCLVRKTRQIQNGAGSADDTPAPNAPTGDNGQNNDTTDLDPAQVLAGAVAVWPLWGGPGALVKYRDGTERSYRGLDYDRVSAQAKAQAMQRGVNDYYYMPMA